MTKERVLPEENPATQIGGDATTERTRLQAIWRDDTERQKGLTWSWFRQLSCGSGARIGLR